LLCNVFYSLQEFYLNNHWRGPLVGKSVYLSNFMSFWSIYSY
jgi:hypothetical protein